MNTFTSCLLAGAVVVSIAFPAHAERPGPDWMGIDHVVRTLSEAGYRDVTEIEADDGVWEAKASKDGTRFEIKVDPRSGAITAEPKRR